ncbi:P-loop containing nucleoside triphosphate hydrolase protein [Apiosordaria backusii]|uniref:Elongation factor 1-alpha n=1 Tax=Apiosordaria backusii TaxID=314023 RepID=A0AA40ENE7_9PEZI|nr:P-loop containing nucleoside triphosphate hydrolase protein [Apiosordaria backusii]
MSNNVQESWEDDSSAQDENLARQAQQMNLNQQGSFRPGAASFQPTAQTFQPGQGYGGYNQYGQQQQYYGGQGQGYYGQYGQQQGYGQGYGGVYGQNQGGYNQGQGYGQWQGYQQQQQQQQQQYPYQPQQQQQTQQTQQQAPKPTPTIVKRPAQPAQGEASKPAPAKDIGAKVLSIGGDAKPKVLSIGNPAPAKEEAPKAKVLSIGNPAPAKEEPKKEEVKKQEAKNEGTAQAAQKVAATKAVEKNDPQAASGKTSPAPSSGRSSPSRAAGAKAAARDVDAVEKEQTADVDDETLKEVYGKEHVNIIFIGHVDAGKSTLGGAILYVTGMVDQRTLDKYKRDAKEMGRETWYLSWALDLTNEERSKGKTVEVGRGFFETDKRRYSILDAPGHKTYVPNMIGGASQADVGILVISARKGEYETGFEKGGQTREHAMLAKTQGVNKLIVAINKMDDPTVNWSHERYLECTTKLQQFLKGTGYNLKTDVFFMPIAAQQTMGIKDRVPKDVCPWYDGPSLLEYLDNMKALERKINAPFMMAVAGKYRDMGTMVEGKIEAGVIKKGMSVVMMPNKQTVDIAAVYGETEDEMTIAQCGDQVRLRLRGIEEEEIMPGFVLCSTKRLVHNVSQFEAQIRILDLKSILTAGFNCVLHVHAAIEEVTFAALLHKLQKGTNRKSKLPPSHAKKGDSIIARLQVTGGAGSVCVERFEDYPQMGRFTLRDQVSFCCLCFLHLNRY